MVSGPPPIPYRARSKGTDAQLANARVALGISWRSILFFVALILGLFAMLYVLG
jgi:hypothetical protein